MWSQTDSTSSTMCVEIRIILFVRMPEIKFLKRNRSSGSKPAVGSSTIMRDGDPKRVCAIPNRRTMPPDRDATLSFARSAKWTCSKHSIAHIRYCDLGIFFNAAKYSIVSRTVSSLNIPNFCGKYPMLSAPEIFPWVGWRIPAIQRISVVLPAPFGPSRPYTPSSRCKSTSSNAVFLPKRMLTFLNSSIVVTS